MQTIKGTIKGTRIRRKLALFVALAMALTLWTAAPEQARAAISGLLEYEVPGNNEAVITGYRGTPVTLTIPSTLGGYPVTGIRSNAFYSCRSLTSITIPDSVTSIGTTSGDSSNIFYDCTSLSAIEVSTGNVNYSSVNGVLYDKAKATLIAYPAAKAGTSYTIPSTVDVIAERAFYNCSALTEIDIPDGVTSIESSTFYGCSALAAIEIPAGVTDIGSGAFSGCSALTEIDIPDGVESVKSYTFNGCSSLTEIEIPESVTDIGSGAFYGCSALIEIAIPDGVASIKDSTFNGCSSLTKIEIPESVTDIGSRTFYGCSALTQINIPDSVASIEDSTFYGCSALADINIPGSVEYIGYGAFYNCRSLTEVTLPASVENIRFPLISDVDQLDYLRGPFGGCTSLVAIKVEEGNRSYSSLDGVLFNKSKTVLLQYPSGKSDENYVIPQGVESIRVHAFESCEFLSTVTIPDSVEDIAFSSLEGSQYLSFKGCKRLTSFNVDDTNSNYSSIDGVLFNKEGTRLCAYPPHNHRTAYTIPSNVTYINAFSFYKCEYLTDVKIPDSVTRIGWYAFYGSSSLAKVTILGKSVNIDSRANVFSECPLTIFCYSGSAVHRFAVEKGIPFELIDGVDTDPDIALISIALDKAALKLDVGKSASLAVKYNPVDATEKPVVAWSTSNAQFATVDGAGKVTAKAAGVTTITATVKARAGTKTATCSVTVVGTGGGKKPDPTIAIKSVALDKTALELAPGKSDTLTVKYNPANTTEKPAVSWSSSDRKVADVDASGKVTGKAEGVAIITVTAKTKSGTKTASCTVTVIHPVSKLSTPLKTVYMKKNSSVTIPVTAYASDGKVTRVKLDWRSSNEAVATVNAAGKVTAKKKGTAKITAEILNGKSVTVTVKVVDKAKKPTKIAIKGAPKTMKKGKTAQLTVKISPASATNVKVTFKSSKSAVLSVDASGKLTAKKKGKATITVKAGGKAAKKTIQVK